ncbi:MAG: restriction endonuclease, partial [Oscillibacter sp.]|nr:restriction endonuclease [Oscillibacter sp.]
AGDQGADIVCWKGLRRYVIQCKCYTGKLGNKPVQEAHAAIAFFGNPFIELDKAVVMTNSTFTPDGKKAAEKCRVLLWDREKLREMCR